MRVASSLWVAAYLRRCHAAGAYAVVGRRGSPEAGAILVVVDRLDGSSDLYAPAPQTEFMEGAPADRRFQRILERATSDVLQERLRGETRFDADVWVVAVEDREGRSFIDPPPRT